MHKHGIINTRCFELTWIAPSLKCTLRMSLARTFHYTLTLTHHTPQRTELVCASVVPDSGSTCIDLIFPPKVRQV